jgi:hypothetical protein
MQDCPASSYGNLGRHLYRVEDILRGHPGDGHPGDCIGVLDGVSLLLLDLSVSFTDHQPVFHASSKPLGHSGSQVADHEGDLGQGGEAVPVKGTSCSMEIRGWGVKFGDSFLLETPKDSFTIKQPIFHASYQPLGHSGREATDGEGELGRQGGAVHGQGVWGDGARGDRVREWPAEMSEANQDICGKSLRYTWSRRVELDTSTGVLLFNLPALQSLSTVIMRELHTFKHCSLMYPAFRVEGNNWNFLFISDSEYRGGRRGDSSSEASFVKIWRRNCDIFELIKLVQKLGRNILSRKDICSKYFRRNISNDQSEGN